MHKFIFVFVFLIPQWLYAATQVIDKAMPASMVQATAFWYQEKETGTQPSLVRYLVTDDYLRIDEGQAGDSFILYDVKQQKIFSINHDDQTLMIINHYDWAMPKLDFTHQTQHQVLDEAPKITGKTVHRYWVKTGDAVCTDVHLIEGLYPRQMQVFKQYQQHLSGQQVQSLNNTPSEMQTPCFLLDQIYNDGQFYDLGLPVQEWHSRGYVKYLKDFKQLSVSSELFTLPKAYKVYYPYSGE